MIGRDTDKVLVLTVSIASILSLLTGLCGSRLLNAIVLKHKSDHAGPPLKTGDLPTCEGWNLHSFARGRERLAPTEASSLTHFCSPFPEAELPRRNSPQSIQTCHPRVSEEAGVQGSGIKLKLGRMKRVGQQPKAKEAPSCRQHRFSQVSRPTASWVCSGETLTQSTEALRVQRGLRTLFSSRCRPGRPD